MLKKNKKAYTLIEMMVVMSIMAILALLGASAMYSANDDNVVEEVAQNLLSGVREVQTRAISVTPDSASHTPKAWTAQVQVPTSGNNYVYFSKRSYYVSPASYSCGSSVLNGNYLEPSSNITSRAGVGLTFTNVATNAAITGPVYFTFNTPFAKSFVTVGGTFIPAGACKWEPTCFPEQDWKPTCASNLINLTQPGQGVKIHVTYRGASRDLYVKTNGDAYVD